MKLTAKSKKLLNKLSPFTSSCKNNSLFGGRISALTSAGDFHSALLHLTKTACTEKKIDSLERWDGKQPRNRDTHEGCKQGSAPAGFHFWPENCPLINSIFSGSTSFTLAQKDSH